MVRSNGLRFAKHMTTLFSVARLSQLQCSRARCPPRLASCANRTWCRCNPFAKWHRRTATPSNLAMSVWRAFLSRNAPLVGQTLDEPCLNKDPPTASSKGGNSATDYRAFQMREDSCSPTSIVRLSRI
jgi:hypothetical protein